MKKLIVILGPTAVGKTKISIEVAKHYGLEIINGDSVAIYKKLDIGSAKPTKEEMDSVKHYLIDVKDPSESYSVYDFQRDARKIIDESDNTKIISGGTGLYISSVIYNYEFEASERKHTDEEKYKDYTNEELYNLLIEKDPNIDKSKIHPNNRKRVIRAIEVITETNKSIHSYNKKNESVYDYYIIYLNMDRASLYERINKRVDLMIDAGLEKEVRDLYSLGIKPHAIGYQEFIPYFEGKESIDEVIEKIKLNTRHLAKRQETWFKNQMDTHFYTVNPDNLNLTINSIISDLDRWLS